MSLLHTLISHPKYVKLAHNGFCVINIFVWLIKTTIWSNITPAQFYLSTADIGKPRAAATLDKLAELNNYVAVSAHTGELDEAFISKFQVWTTLNSHLV